MTATPLRLSPDLSLPLDFVTKTAGILAQRRKGKTYTASVIAEELIAAKVPTVVLDPTGAWWGLRASADGQKAGLPVVILGGSHGDVPLERTGGKFVAELVVDEPGFYVIDFSLFESGEAERQFATDFAERLYRRKGQPNSDFPLHLIVDEADRFTPQRVPSGDQRMLGAFEAIVRRGGLRGLGTTLISQRAAVVNKNVLEQVDLLIVLRVVGPNDREAIERYVKAHGTDEERKALMDSLSSLDLGEAWVWEPGADPPLFERIRVRERHTFNSSATPKAGEKRVEPRRLADVDINAIKEAMADTIERAKADDPKELHRRIIQLEKELKQRLTEPAIERVEVPVEVPILNLDPSEAFAAVDKMERLVSEAVEPFRVDLARAVAILEESRRDRQQTGNGAGGVERQALRTVHDSSGRKRDIDKRSSERADSPPRRESRSQAVPGATADGLGKRERLILSVLAQYPTGRTQSQLAILTGYSARASTISAGLSALRKLGYVEAQGSPVRITQAGLDAIEGAYEPLPTGAALLDYWMGELGQRERLLLRALLDAYPEPRTHEELAAETGYSPEASTISAGMSKLRKLELAEGWRASDDFVAAIS